jgi:hypothetical protein
VRRLTPLGQPLAGRGVTTTLGSLSREGTRGSSQLSPDQTLSATTFVLEPEFPWAAGVQSTDGPLDQVAIFVGGFRKDCLLRSVSALGASVSGELATEAGSQVALELPTGQRPAGTIEWINGLDAGVRFKAPVNVMPLINRQLLSQPVERRKLPRVELRCNAWVELDGEFTSAIVRNVSAGGVQLEGQSLPEVGSDVRLFIEGLNVPPAKVIWKKGELAGLQFTVELPWASVFHWVREVARTSQYNSEPPSSEA